METISLGVLILIVLVVLIATVLPLIFALFFWIGRVGMRLGPRHKA